MNSLDFFKTCQLTQIAAVLSALACLVLPALASDLPHLSYELNEEGLQAEFAVGDYCEGLSVEYSKSGEEWNALNLRVGFSVDELEALCESSDAAKRVQCLPMFEIMPSLAVEIECNKDQKSVPTGVAVVCVKEASDSDYIPRHPRMVCNDEDDSQFEATAYPMKKKTVQRSSEDSLPVYANLGSPTLEPGLALSSSSLESGRDTIDGSEFDLGLPPGSQPIPSRLGPESENRLVEKSKELRDLSQELKREVDEFVVRNDAELSEAYMLRQSVAECGTKVRRLVLEHQRQCRQPADGCDTTAGFLDEARGNVRMAMRNLREDAGKDFHAALGYCCEPLEDCTFSACKLMEDVEYACLEAGVPVDCRTRHKPVIGATKIACEPLAPRGY
ncbi:MAG: hypothetical protein AAF560_24610 [Acidobacteriota bacterium]